jgi:iron complex outermembrane receptor protein
MKEVYFYKKMGNVRLDYKFHFFEDLRAVVEAGIEI